MLLSTVAPTEPSDNSTEPADKEEAGGQTESAPTEASTAPTNATDGGLFSGVGEWVGNAADTVTGTVANATGGFTDWVGSLVNANNDTKEEEAVETDETVAKEETAAESETETVEGPEKDDTPDSGVANLISASVLAASVVASVALF